MASTADPRWLQEHGIDLAPEAFLRLVRDAVTRIASPQPASDPHDDLTPAEVEVLERGGFDLSARDLGDADPLARTAAEFAALLATSASTADVAERLGVDASRVRQLLGANRLFGVRSDAGWRIPTFQLTDRGLLPALGEVVAALDPALHPVAVHRWFTTRADDLPTEHGPLSPRDWLRAGYPPATVIELARHL